MELEMKTNDCICQSSSVCPSCDASKKSVENVSGGLDSASASGPVSAGGLDSATTSSADTSKTIKISFGRRNENNDLIIDHEIDRKLACEKSSVIKNALDQDPDAIVELDFIKQNNLDKEFLSFVKFLSLTYVEIPRPFARPPNTPSHVKLDHISKHNCGSDENATFINNFYDKTEVNKNGFPVELKRTLCLANYLGATEFLHWVAAKTASVLLELGLTKID